MSRRKRGGAPPGRVAADEERRIAADRQSRIAAEPRLAQFVQLFDEGRWFEAHEVLEALWLDAPPESRDLLQGLVQIAVALEHHRRGNPVGAVKVLARARSRLAASGVAAGHEPGAGGLGFDAGHLLREAEAFIKGRREAPPTIGTAKGRPRRRRPGADQGR